MRSRTTWNAARMPKPPGRVKLATRYGAVNVADQDDEYLAVGSIRVKMREWNKALREAGPEPFEMFKSIVKAANRGVVGHPTVTIEA